MKHRFISISFAVAAVLAAVSCAPKPYINLTESSIEVAAEGLSKTVSFTTNNAWNASTPDNWILLYNDSGNGGNTSFSLYVLPNDTFAERQGSITITSAGETAVISVRQAQNNGLEVNEWMKTVGCEGGEIEVSVQTNEGLTVEIPSDADWVKIADTKALSTYAITLSVSANETDENRTAAIRFVNASGLDRHLVISQRGKMPTVVICHELADFTLPAISYTGDSPMVDWGDGSIEPFIKDMSHTYSVLGEHTVTVYAKGLTGCTFTGIDGVISFDHINF